MENYQVNDISSLVNKNIINSSYRLLKMPNQYADKFKAYWNEQINKKYADIDIIDDDDNDSSQHSLLTLDYNAILKNKYVSVDYESLNIIQIPLKQVNKIKEFYLSQLPVVIPKPDFVLDNSLELYRLREENKQLKEEITRLKYLSSKNNNV